MLKDILFIEKILYESFEKEPFHNFYQRYNIEPRTFEFGGTCSDKSLSFLNKLKSYGYDAHLYSSWIDGRETHRVVRINLDGVPYLADVGNGWPSIHLYSMLECISFTAFGMQFNSEILDDRIRVYHTNKGKVHLLFEAFFKCKPEEEILRDIANRFSSGIQYPFSGKIRFSQIVGKNFLFLKDDSLRIYNDSNCSEISGLSTKSLSDTIRKYFNFDLDAFEKMNSIRIE